MRPSARVLDLNPLRASPPDQPERRTFRFYEMNSRLTAEITNPFRGPNFFRIQIGKPGANKKSEQQDEGFFSGAKRCGKYTGRRSICIMFSLLKKVPIDGDSCRYNQSIRPTCEEGTRLYYGVDARARVCTHFVKNVVFSTQTYLQKSAGMLTMTIDKLSTLKFPCFHCYRLKFWQQWQFLQKYLSPHL